MRLSRNAKTLLAGLAALALAAGVMGFLRFKRFVDEDPRLCATCHRSSPEFALWMGGSHKGVSCQRCHHSTPQQGIAMLRSFLAGKKPSGKHAEVTVGSCEQCHFSHDPRWPQVGGSRGHRIHYEEKKIACIRCHAASMHGFEPVASKCQECHPGHAVGIGGMQALQQHPNPSCPQSRRRRRSESGAAQCAGRRERRSSSLYHPPSRAKVHPTPARNP